MDSSNRTSSGARSLRDLLDERCIDPALEAADRTTALRNLLGLLVRSGKLHDEKAALAALLEREEQSSTAIGRGVAVPHAEVTGISVPVLALGISRGPIGFSSLDQEPVHLVFLLLFPQGGGGLRMRLVGQVMRLMRNPDARQALRSAATAGQAKERLLEFLAGPRPGEKGRKL